jgi:hypothetical protein
VGPRRGLGCPVSCAAPAPGGRWACCCDRGPVRPPVAPCWPMLYHGTTLLASRRRRLQELVTHSRRDKMWGDGGVEQGELLLANGAIDYRGRSLLAPHFGRPVLSRTVLRHSIKRPCSWQSVEGLGGCHSLASLSLRGGVPALCLFALLAVADPGGDRPGSFLSEARATAIPWTLRVGLATTRCGHRPSSVYRGCRPRGRAVADTGWPGVSGVLRGATRGARLAASYCGAVPEVRARTSGEGPSGLAVHHATGLAPFSLHCVCSCRLPLSGVPSKLYVPVCGARHGWPAASGCPRRWGGSHAFCTMRAGAASRTRVRVERVGAGGGAGVLRGYAWPFG